MANSSDKKIHNANQLTLRHLRVAFFFVNLVYLLVKLIASRGILRQASGWWLYCISNGMAITCYRILSNFAQPTFDSNGRIISSGTDINASGLSEYLIDCIIVTWAVQLLSLVWRRVWWVYVVIPVYLVVRIFQTFFSPMLRAAARASIQRQQKAK